jgi:excisionase family DNA binding protein
MSSVSTGSRDEAKRPAAPRRTAYSAQEAAQMLGLSESSIWRAIRRGQLKATKIGGRTLIAAHQIDGLFDAAA